MSTVASARVSATSQTCSPARCAAITITAPALACDLSRAYAQAGSASRADHVKSAKFRIIPKVVP